MKKNEYKKKTILITAGPTIEPIDPVRYISNYSTGVMGYTIAKKAAKKGYTVILISGPVARKEPVGIKMVNVLTAREMQKAVKKNIRKAECLIMTAAVCDFRAAREGKTKIKKKDTMVLNLIKNPDILKSVKTEKNVYKIAFALETGQLIKNAKKKMLDKEANLIVANKKSGEKDPFGEGRKDFIIINPSGEIEELMGITKDGLAGRLLAEIEKRIQ